MRWGYELNLWGEPVSQIYRETQISKLALFEYIDVASVLS